MDAVDYLSEEHIAHRKILERVLSSETSEFSSVRSALIRHIHLEETVLFPNYQELAEVRKAWFEHNDLMRIIKELDENFSLEKVKQLLLLHEDHTREEESFLFPLLRKHLPEDVLTDIHYSCKKEL